MGIEATFGNGSMDQHIHDACKIADAAAPRSDKFSVGPSEGNDWKPPAWGTAQDALARQRLARLPTDSDKRKAVPIYSGFIQYFPDAIAEVAKLSHAATQKHHPGEPLHWSRSKSDDHLDCLARHLLEAGTLDADGFYHDVKIAWRALTNLQVLLERVRGLPISPGSRP